MQDEKQFEQLMLQYQQLKQGSEDISRMIDNEDYDAALTMIKARAEIFLNCKCMLNYLELTSTQKKELDALVEELQNSEMQNIKKIEKKMDAVQAELKQVQATQKLQNAYENDVDNKGSIININE